MKTNRIKAEMILRNITGVEIAKKIGVTKQYVSAVITGKRRCDFIESAIAESIGHPVELVFPVTKEKA